MSTSPRLAKLISVLAVRDHEATRNYFEEILGFTVDHADHEWVMLERDSARIHLGHCPDDMPASEIGCHNWFATILVDNIEGLEKEYLYKGAVFGHPLRDCGNWRDFSIKAPEGHTLVFGELPSQRNKNG